VRDRLSVIESLPLPPALAELYAKMVSNLQDALADPATQAEALEILRSLIERVSVRAHENASEIELVGEIAIMARHLRR
jgi:hypothetical protein